jgi:glycosyltransferase involved in cell wall biosynthesis
VNFLHETGRSIKKQQRDLEKLQKKIDRADYVVAISLFVANDIKKHFSIAADKLKVIYNGCNINEQQQLQQPSMPIATPFLFTIGTIVEKKNFHVLPALLVGNNLMLVIAGVAIKNDYLQQIKEEAEKLGVAERLVFTGAISDGEKYWYYQHCRAFVFPSLMEGFGLPVVEAMAFGKPIFLSNLTSLPEIGGDVVNYFNSFDGPSMQEVLNIGLKNYDADESLQQKIKERSKLFSWQASAKAYIETYSQVLAQ